MDNTKEKVKTLYRSALEIRERQLSQDERDEIIEALGDRRINFEDLKTVTNFCERYGQDATEMLNVKISLQVLKS